MAPSYLNPVHLSNGASDIFAPTILTQHKVYDVWGKTEKHNLLGKYTVITISTTTTIIIIAFTEHSLRTRHCVELHTHSWDLRWPCDLAGPQNAAQVKLCLF